MGKRARRLRRRLRRQARDQKAAIRQKRGNTGGPFVTGFVLLSAGAFFLGERLGIVAFEPERLWPMIMVAVGFGFLLSLPFGRAAGKVIPGMINLLLGGFFLLFTTERLDWGQLSELWPVFPLVVGVAFGTSFLASFGTKPGLLVPGFICFAVGTIGLAFTLTPLGGVFAFLGWPVILLALGAIFVLGGILRLIVRSVGYLARA